MLPFNDGDYSVYHLVTDISDIMDNATDTISRYEKFKNAVKSKSIFLHGED